MITNFIRNLFFVARMQHQRNTGNRYPKKASGLSAFAPLRQGFGGQADNDDFSLRHPPRAPKIKPALLIALSLIFNGAYAKPVLNIQRWQTKQGSKVYFVTNRDLPIVDMAVVFHAGSSQDGADFGIANMTAELLDTGTKTQDEDQLALNFDNIGAQYGEHAERDMAVFSLRSLSTPDILNKATHTFTDILNHPSFPTQSFKRLQRQTLLAIEHSTQYPDVIATRTFFQTLYGKASAYGHSAMGVAATVKSLSPAKLKKFYQQYYTTKNAKIILVGDLSTEQAKDLSNKLLAERPTGKQAAVTPSDTNAKTNNLTTPDKTITIKFPAAQSNIMIGQLALVGYDKDRLTYKLGNAILGGGTLSSMLNKAVREKAGFTYGISSDFILFRGLSPFLINFKTRNQVTLDAIDLTKKIVTSYIKNGPDRKALTFAKKSLIGQFPLGLDNNSHIMTNLINYAFYHLPKDYFDTYQQKINNISAKQIKQAFQKTLNTKHMVTVIVGSPDAKSK